MEIPDDAVFIPGHSGDLIGGSQLIKAFDKDILHKEILDIRIFMKHISALHATQL